MEKHLYSVYGSTAGHEGGRETDWLFAPMGSLVVPLGNSPGTVSGRSANCETPR